MLNPRLAIGASWNPNVFDHSGILSLCLTDPGVGPHWPASSGAPFTAGQLANVKFQHSAVPVLAMRSAADLGSPRQFKRTGFGTKLKWELGLTYEASANSPTGVPWGSEGTDASLFSLASLLGLSTPGISRAAFSPFPPYLFLTTTYQTFNELWFPVNLDPDDTSDPRSLYGPKTILVSMDLTFVSRVTYKRVNFYYLPSVYTYPSPAMITTLSHPGTGIGPFAGTIAFDSALDARVQVGDAILVWFKNLNGISGGQYRWDRFVFTAIAGNRLSGSVISATQWPGPINYPSVTEKGSFRIQFVDSTLRMPIYNVTTFGGAVLPSGMVPNDTNTQLIGGFI